MKEKMDFKVLFYIILPFIVIASVILGRIITFEYGGDVILSYVDSSKDFLLKSLPVIFIDLGMLLYLLYMAVRMKKKQIPYLFMEKVIMSMIFAILIEFNFGTLILETDWGLAYAYSFTYIITIPFTLLILYMWIIHSDKKSFREKQ